MELKPCPICRSKNLQYIYYAPAAESNPDLWEEDEDGYNPLILAKRVECADCGASMPRLVLTIDEADADWNSLNEETGRRWVLQCVGKEKCRRVDDG